MGNPLTKRPIRPQELINSLNDIGGDIDSVREKAIHFEQTGRVDDEMSMTLALSGLEIKFTNFAKDMRERLV